MRRTLYAILIAAAVPSGAFTVDAAKSAIQFTVIHKLHRVEGKSNEIEGKAVVKDDGTVQAMVRVSVASFRSGDANRDEHMLEALEAGKFPYVVFKGVAQLPPGRAVPIPSLEMQGEVQLHGVTRPMRVSLSLAPQRDRSIRGQGSFDISLDAHGIQRPSLMFVKIEDTCHITFDLVFRAGR